MSKKKHDVLAAFAKAGIHFSKYQNSWLYQSWEGYVAFNHDEDGCLTRAVCCLETHQTSHNLFRLVDILVTIFSEDAIRDPMFSDRLLQSIHKKQELIEIHLTFRIKITGEGNVANLIFQMTTPNESGNTTAYILSDAEKPEHPH